MTVRVAEGDQNRLTIRNTGQSLLARVSVSAGSHRLWYSFADIVRVIREQSPDTESGRALGAWVFLRDRLSHHLNAGYDAPAYDIVDIVNSYGFGGCTQIATGIMQVWQGLGLKVREVGVLGHHNISEVWADGDWRLMDADEQVLYLNADNRTISNLEKLRQNPLLARRLLDPRGILKPHTLVQLPAFLQRNAPEIYILPENTYRQPSLAALVHREASLDLGPGEEIVIFGDAPYAPVWTFALYNAPPPDWMNGCWVRRFPVQKGRPSRITLVSPWVMTGLTAGAAGGPPALILTNEVRGRHAFQFDATGSGDGEMEVRVRFQISAAIGRRLFEHADRLTASCDGNAADLDVEVTRLRAPEPPVFALTPVTPAPGQSLSGPDRLNPLFVWNSTAPRPATYRIQIGLTPDFSDPLALMLDEPTRLEEPMWRLPVCEGGGARLCWLSEGTEYHWRVKAILGGREGEWVAMGAFKTGPSPASPAA